MTAANDNTPLPSVLSAPPSQLLHPAYDLQDDVVSVGFSAKRALKTTIVREPLRIVSVNGQVGYIGKGLKGIISGREIRYRDDLSLKVLPDLDQQWNREDLMQFLKSPRCLRGYELYQRLTAKLREHAEFDHDGVYTILAAWIMGTYAYLAFSSVPFLHLLGPKGSGKSQMLELLEQLVRNGIKAKATAASVGDQIEAQRATLLIDQVNCLALELVDLLADSYRAGTRRMIANTKDRSKPFVFETFGPKAFAGTQSVDEDLTDRMIQVATVKVQRKFAPVRADDPDFQQLRAECYKWTLKNGSLVRPMAETMQEAKESELLQAEWTGLYSYWGRELDLWLPIECMMEMLQVPTPDREAARDYYQRSQASTRADVPQDTLVLLRVLLAVVGDRDTASVTTSQVFSKLQEHVPPDELDQWNDKKIGRRIASLNVLHDKGRAEGNTVTVYHLDCDAVRQKCERMGVLTKTT